MGSSPSVYFGLGQYGSGLKWVGSFRVWVISGHVQSSVRFGSVMGRVTLGVRVKPVVFISDVGSGMDSGCSVRVSGLGSVLPGLGIPFC